MKENWVYRRGDIYLANLGVPIGSKQGGVRPVVVLQNDVGNFYSPTITVAPLTTKIQKKRSQPTHYFLRKAKGLARSSMVLAEQLDTCDKTCVIRYLGKVSKGQMRGIDEAVKVQLGYYIPEQAEKKRQVTTDDLRLLLVPISKQSASLYSKMNMLIKCVFYSAEESKIISCNPAASLSAKGGTPKQEKKALTDEQVKILLDTIRGLPPYVFVMIGLYAGLRREEILALRWDCVFLDGATPYISVRRAWRSVNNRPVISTELKTPAAKRDIPIPGKLVECLKEAKEKSKSEYVISDRNGNALAESQFVRVWKYIAVRSTEERCYYTYVNGQKIKHVVKPKLGEHQSNNPKLVYTMDFQVTPHQLRHTYITNLIYASVDPKTVQYLAGHENSKVTMDIYAKVKYNKPAQLHGVINRAIDTSKKD